MALPHLRAEAGGRRLLDDLLMPALQRAVALEQMHGTRRAGRRTPAPRHGAAARSAARAAPCRRRTPPWPRAGRPPACLQELAPAASTRRMPLPPPPAVALISIGKPMPLGLGAQARIALVGAVIARHQRHARPAPAAPWRCPCRPAAPWPRPAGRRRSGRRRAPRRRRRRSPTGSRSRDAPPRPRSAGRHPAGDRPAR